MQGHEGDWRWGAEAGRTMRDKTSAAQATKISTLSIEIHWQAGAPSADRTNGE